MKPASKPYEGEKASLLTQHGKEAVVCPELLTGCGITVVHQKGFDTDSLGTFTGDIPRSGSQLEAARTKARIGMQFGGLTLGLASEGSFSPDPFTGLVPWNNEIVIFLDDIRGIEIIGANAAPGQFTTAVLSSWDEVLIFAKQAGFPEHLLTVTPDGDGNKAAFIKGIGSIEELSAAFERAVRRADNRRAVLANDLRAHANPTRMSNILCATRDLVARINSLCPACETPGFWVKENKPGLPCSLCQQPTRMTLAKVWSCLKCNHSKHEYPEGGMDADPSVCDYCNP